MAIINVSLARQLVGGAGAEAVEAAIGKRIRIGADPKAPEAEIVGVVTDASPGDVRISRQPMVYRPIFQEPAALIVPVFVLRARGTEAFAAAVRQTVAASGRYYVGAIRSIEEQIARTMVTERTLFVLSSFVGGLSVLLAALGLYSLLAYSVGRRMRELALRMALGASHTAVMSMVIREGLTLAVLGIILGVPIALACGRLSRSYLEELPASSVGLVAAVGALLMVIGLIAVAAPARRAAERIRRWRCANNEAPGANLLAASGQTEAASFRLTEHACFPVRRPSRAPWMAARACLHADRHRLDGARHRRQHRDFHAGRSGAAADASDPAAAGARAAHATRRGLRQQLG